MITQEATRKRILELQNQIEVITKEKETYMKQIGLSSFQIDSYTNQIKQAIEAHGICAGKIAQIEDELKHLQSTFIAEIEK